MCARPPVNHSSSEMSPGRLWPSPFLPLIMAPIDNQQALVAYPITIGWIWMESRKLKNPNLWFIFDFDFYKCFYGATATVLKYNSKKYLKLAMIFGWGIQTLDGNDKLPLQCTFVTEFAPARHSLLDSRHPSHPFPPTYSPPPSNNLPSPTFCGFPAGPFTRPKAELTMLCDIIVGHVRTVRALDTAEVCQPIYS